MVVAIPMAIHPTTDIIDSIENGSIVYELPSAPDEEEPLTFSFSYSPACSYYFWFHPNELKIQYLISHTIFHDHSSKFLCQNYRSIMNLSKHAGYSDFSLNFLHTIAAIAQQDMTRETSELLSSLMLPSKISLSSPSMKALEEITVALIDVNVKKLPHEELSRAAMPFFKAYIGANPSLHDLVLVSLESYGQITSTFLLNDLILLSY